MKVLKPGIYYVKDAEGDYKLWHDCTAYKERDLARVEIERQTDDDITATYECSFCGFTYELDKTINYK